MSAVETFRSIVPFIVSRLLGDFPLGADDCLAIAGNGGHESAGFTALQERQPTVKGSRGGWGLMQWTGSRRRAFEAYCRRNGLDPQSIATNYAWLFLELKSSERKAIGAVKAAAGLRGKVEAFELSFLRAGVKHYDSREQWAKIAADEWHRAGAMPAPTPAGERKAMLEDEATASTTRATASGKVAIGTGVGTAADGAAAVQLADLLLVGIGIGLLAVCVFFALRALQDDRRAEALAAAAAEVA